MEEKKELSFSKLGLEELVTRFKLKEKKPTNHETWRLWQATAEQIQVSELEKAAIQELSEWLLMYGKGWNEVELESRFIGPLMNLTKLQDEEIGYFMERPLTADYEGTILSGIVDGMLATGRYEPKAPYFCMQEFKKNKDPKGDPQAQALGAMLAAQALNQDGKPIYGLFIIGVSWWFMVLEGKTFVTSSSYGADGKDVLDIFKLLRALKVLIFKD